ncbi:MAG: Holliday junction resolvase RuvX [Chloroflexi bacterium]|nr:MAG: Holliday junction resolvase RuvX [Chloroflexota bacterium]MBL1196555.1 Holliday junction resolvase RuvX [Chloroflexota bacterium]NOH13850.1 Holliday junction resolvase RuvX [Chloroflexota bacterium]
MRILAVDPGAKRIGLALSDPTATIASPLEVLKHSSRPIDAATIAQIATENEAVKIVMGQSLDQDGKPTIEGRRAARLAAAIRMQTELPVEMWDEFGTTKAAVQARIDLGAPRSKRGGHQDELAAALILQSYLDAHSDE